MRDLRIVFMGTPEFAVPSLERLIEAGWNVVGVITAPDKPRGRGRQLSPPPVKAYAAAQGLKVLQPTNLKSDPFMEELLALEANLQVVVAFRMLPEKVWSYPEYGTFNLHASLLPQYRGAAPIPWAIIEGEKETGVTTFFLKHAIDTGNIIFQEKEPIYPDDTGGSLYTRLMHKGAELVERTVSAIARDEAPTQAQPETGELKKAPKIFRETCEINWNQPTQKVVDFVRALAPYPGAWADIKGNTCKIFRVKPLPLPSNRPPGVIDTDQASYLHIATANGMVSVEEFQPPGKKAMPVKDYFRGNTL